MRIWTLADIDQTLSDSDQLLILAYCDVDGLKKVNDGDSLAELMDRSDSALRKSRVSRR